LRSMVVVKNFFPSFEEFSQTATSTEPTFKLLIGFISNPSKNKKPIFGQLTLPLYFVLKVKGKSFESNQTAGCPLFDCLQKTLLKITSSRRRNLEFSFPHTQQTLLFLIQPYLFPLKILVQPLMGRTIKSLQNF